MDEEISIRIDWLYHRYPWLDQAVKDYETGRASMQQIADRVGFSRQYIHKLFRHDLLVPKRHRARCLEYEQVTEVISMYKAGEKPTTIVRKFGISKYTLYHLLKENGIITKQERRCRLYGWVINSYQAGYCSTEIAEAMQGSPSGVLLILERAGVPRHRRPCKGGLVSP